MKKLTITLDDSAADWVETYAAQCGKSVSDLLGEMLQGAHA